MEGATSRAASRSKGMRLEEGQVGGVRLERVR